MQATKFLAHCGACGHAYRISDPERTYGCKECGGTVAVDDELEEYAYDEDEDEDEEQPELEHRSLSARHQHEDKASPLRWIIPILAIVVMGGGGLYSLGYFDKWVGGEKDLVKVVDTVKGSWAINDRVGLRTHFHPDVAERFDATIDKVLGRAGLDGILPTITSGTGQLTDGSAERPRLGVSNFTLAGTPSWADLTWQFEPAHNRWYVVGLRFGPPSLDDRVARLQELWAESSLEALRPMYSTKNAPRMIEILGTLTKNRRWTTFPVLEDPVTTGLEQASTPAALAEGTSTVTTTFHTRRGDVTVKWGFNGVHHDWMIKGYELPPR